MTKTQILKHSKNKWLATHPRSLINGFPAIRHSVTDELAIYGVLGTIWEYAEGEYRAVFLKHHGNEKIIKFKKDEFAYWLRRIQAVKDRDSQVKIAESF